MSLCITSNDVYTKLNKLKRDLIIDSIYPINSKKSKGNNEKQPQHAQKGISIYDFKAKENLPVYLICKNDHPIMCKHWINILEGIANYLIENNYINESDCPIKSGPKNAILNTSKKHQTGVAMRWHKQIKRNFYLNTNLSTQGMIDNAKKLLKYSNLPLDDFRITEQTPAVTTQSVPIEKTNQDYTLLKFQPNVQLPSENKKQQQQQQTQKGISIYDFKAKENLPVYLICKNDHPIMCKHWINILEGIANYLIENNYINESDCPIKSGPKNAILNTSKKHQTGVAMRWHKQIKRNFYLNTNLSTQGMIDNAKKLLKYSNLPLDDFRITEQTPAVTTQSVPIEKTNQDYTLLKFQPNVQLPIEVLYPDQTSKICKAWFHILLHTTSYLVEKNYITRDNCPTLGRKNPIVTKDKPHFNLKVYVQLQSGFYVYRQLNKKSIVKNTIRLIKHVNLNPEDFRIHVIKT